MKAGAKKKKPDYEIVEILGRATPMEDCKTQFAKTVIKSLWHDNGEAKDGIDIRWVDPMGTRSFGGIRLSIAEAHRVTDILLENGYGSKEAITKAYQRRTALYKEGNDG